jgi:hypothetical protein
MNRKVRSADGIYGKNISLYVLRSGRQKNAKMILGELIRLPCCNSDTVFFKSIMIL